MSFSTASFSKGLLQALGPLLGALGSLLGRSCLPFPHHRPWSELGAGCAAPPFAPQNSPQLHSTSHHNFDVISRGPKRRQEAPKRRPRGTQEAPMRPPRGKKIIKFYWFLQYPSEIAFFDPRGAQEVPKRPPRGPKRPQEATTRLPRDLKRSQEVPKKQDRKRSKRGNQAREERKQERKRSKRGNEAT